MRLCSFIEIKNVIAVTQAPRSTARNCQLIYRAILSIFLTEAILKSLALFHMLQPGEEE